MKTSFKHRSLTAAVLLATSVGVQAEEPKLTEVLVTAQKRVQNAQQIPVAVTNFSQDRLDELGVTDLFDLQTSAPSLQVSNSQSASTTSISIRGVGTSGQNFGLESSVGLYVDGVYRARQSAVINELIDIDAVEVLRGPQGTLFGRNTPSGAIHIKTAAPSDKPVAKVGVTAGNYNLVSANAVVGGKLGDNGWTIRATAFTSQRDGHVSDANLGEDTMNDRDRSGARLQLQYQPSERFSARLIADYSEINEICCNATTVLNNRIGAAGQFGSDALLQARGTNIIDQSQVFDNVSALNSLPVSDNQDAGLSLELNWGTEVDGKITSITAVRNFEQFTDIDADFTDARLFRRTELSETSSFSQELRFSKEFQNLDLVVGAYYFDQTIDSGARAIIGQDFAPFISANPLIGQLIAGAQSVGVPVANLAPAGTGSRDAFTQDQKSAALFGQVDYYLTDAWILSGGLRYTKEDKSVVGRFEQDNLGGQVDIAAIQAGDFRSFANLAFPGWGYTLGGPLTVLSQRDDVDAELDDSQVTGTLKLGYNVDQNTFAYVSVGSGFKSGGTNTDRIAPQFDVIFDAETSTSIELGLKKDLPSLGMRLNAALHVTNTDDFQTVAFDGTGFNLTNAGEVETKGGEIELLWYPTDTLSISSAVIINKGEYKSFEGGECWTVAPFQLGVSETPNATGACDRSGGDLAFNPEEVFLFSLNQLIPLGSNEGFLQADYFYRSSAFEDTDLDPLKEQDGYGLLNLRAGLVFNEGASEVSLWMRNALDEDYLGTHFTAPLQDGKLNAYVQEPRTYGVSFKHEF